MQKLYKKAIATLLAACLLLMVRLAQAAPETIISKPAGAGILPGSGSEGADIRSSVVFAKIIPFLITWAINLAIGLSVIALIIGGYLYLTAYGDQEKMDKAKRTFIYAVVGLILALTAYGIVGVLTSIQLT